MDSSEQIKIFGRKIFFVTPPAKISRRVVQELRNMEYETYVIDNYKCVKSILKENPDALCFIYLDSFLPSTQSYKFIKTFEYDEKLKDIFIGLLSDKISLDKKNFFLMNTNLPGGFTMTNLFDIELLNKIKQILDINNAKGKRQYIRLDCSKIKQVSAFIETNGKLFPLEMCDLSSVGIAVNIPSVLANVFVPKSEISNISLTLDNRTFKISGVVLLTKQAGNKITSVLVLRTNDTLVKAIRNFIFQMLDEKMNNDMKFCLKDETDYAKLDLKDFESYGTISDADDSEEVEEVEEAEEV